MDLHPYPGSLPANLIARVIELFRGAAPNIEDAHRLWHVAGYALSQVDAHPAPKGNAVLDAAAVADKLEALTDPNAPKGDHEAFPWAVVIPLIADILLKLFRR